MDHYPAFLDLKQRPCVVVGGGAVAERKVNTLIQAHAHITVIAPEITIGLQQSYSAGRIQYLAREYQEDDIKNAFLIIAATDNKKLNNHIANQANHANQLVNVVNNPRAGNFVVPSIVDRSPVTVAVSTGGASPVLARQLRMRLESLVPSSTGQLASITEQYRHKVQAAFPRIEQRKKFWENALSGSFSELVYAGHITEATQLLDTLLSETDNTATTVGEVYLVGAGPGDPDLLTLRALRLMQQADIMIYDRLVSKTILDMANHDAERIYVGKQKANHIVPQDQINTLLVEQAKQGKRVLRLKGGDPFIFGRGGEEIETLANEGIPFQVVPGITAASGCASYAGIPLTHRDYAQSCSFVTGHLKEGDLELNWQQLVQPNHTTVFYMGLSGIRVISQKLIQHGMSPTMPAALIEQGTTSHQRVHISDISHLAEKVEQAHVRAPTLIIIGEVVHLHETLHWYHPNKHIKPSEFSYNTTPS